MCLPSVSSKIVRTARKEHLCCECRRAIKRGDRYEILSGCWEGRWADFKTCMNCTRWRSAAYAQISSHDDPLAFGGLSEFWDQGGINIETDFDSDLV